MTEAWVLLLVFAIPLLAGGCLALVGHRHFAAELNVGFSFLTLAAAMLLAAQTVAHLANSSLSIRSMYSWSH